MFSRGNKRRWIAILAFLFSLCHISVAWADGGDETLVHNEEEPSFVRLEKDVTIHDAEGAVVGEFYAGIVVPIEKVEDDKVYLEWDKDEAYITVEDVGFVNIPVDASGMFRSYDEYESAEKIRFIDKAEVYPIGEEEKPFAIINEGVAYSAIKKADEAYHIIVGGQIGTVDASKVAIISPQTSVMTEPQSEDAPNREDKGEASVNGQEKNDHEKSGTVRLHKKARAAFSLNDRYFEVLESDLPIYDNRTGTLVQVGTLKKGQVYPRVRDYGNWHEIKFGKGFGYVWKGATQPANGNSLNNLNSGGSYSGKTFKAMINLTVHDNSSGQLVPFATIPKGQEYPIISDYGNWYRIDVAGRIGYVYKKGTALLFSKDHQFFKVMEPDLPIYDNRTGTLVKVGTLKKGQVYPRVRDYGNWHEIKFGKRYGYVWKGATQPTGGNGLQNLNKGYGDMNQSFKTATNVEVYDNSSGKLISFATLLKGQEYPLISDYGNWYRVDVSGRIGYVHKNGTRLTFSASDKYFEVTEDRVPIYDNSTEQLVQVGTLKKGEVYLRIRDYGNWHEIKFGNGHGYVWKGSTEPSNGDKIKNLSQDSSYGNEFFEAAVDLLVYDNSTGRLMPFATILEGHAYPIASDYGNWYRINIAGRVGYIHKNGAKRVYKWPEQQSQIIKYYKDRNTDQLMEKLDGLFFSPLNKDYIDAADEMLKGIYHIPDYGTFRFTNGIDWSEKTLDNPSYLRQLHAHFYLNDLIKAYEQSPRNDKHQYIHTGYDIISDWIKHNPYGEPAHRMAWHDEATARRLVTWVRFFDVAKDILTETQLTTLMDQMRFHAQLLAGDHFYSAKTNHGMFQDEALIVFSDYFGGLDKSTRFKHLAKKRLKEYFDFIISAEGVHKEHSPSYHHVVASFISKYKNYFESTGDVEISAYFSNLYDSMAKFATFVIKPDGEWPLLADTFPDDSPEEASLWSDNSYYQYAVSQGQKGKKPAETDVVFPDAGYAIFRDSWEKGVSGTYILFTAAYHTDYHKHSDDLSVWIYSNGDLITEAGPNGYDFREPYTQYAYSSFAHNTLIVNDEGLPRVDGKFDSTYIRDYQVGRNVSSVTGVNDRYEGVSHARRLTYHKDENVLTVKDDIRSKSIHNYKILWHLAPGLVPKIDGDRIYVFNGEKHVMDMYVSSTSAMKLRKVYGENDDPLYKGLQFVNREEPLETYVLILETESANAEIETTFHIYDN